MPTEPLRCAGALIVDDDGRILVQRRSPHRRLARPRLEEGKHTEFRWLTEDQLDVLDEHRHVDDGLIRRIAADAFAALRAIGT